MVKMQEAMELAKSFIIKNSGVKQGFHLEEAFFNKKENIWKVTYSFFEKNEWLNTLQEFGGIEGRRVFRTIEIDNENGEILGMKAGFGSNLGVIA
jgi:hypothetical protein